MDAYIVGARDGSAGRLWITVGNTAAAPQTCILTVSLPSSHTPVLPYPRLFASSQGHLWGTGCMPRGLRRLPPAIGQPPHHPPTTRPHAHPSPTAYHTQPPGPILSLSLSLSHPAATHMYNHRIGTGGNRRWGAAPASRAQRTARTGWVWASRASDRAAAGAAAAAAAECGRPNRADAGADGNACVHGDWAPAPRAPRAPRARRPGILDSGFIFDQFLAHFSRRYWAAHAAHDELFVGSAAY